MIPHEPIPYMVIITSSNMVNNTKIDPDYGKCKIYKSLTVVNPRMEFVVSKIIQKETMMEIEDEFSNEVPQNNEKINKDTIEYIKPGKVFEKSKTQKFKYSFDSTKRWNKLCLKSKNSEPGSQK